MIILTVLSVGTDILHYNEINNLFKKTKGMYKMNTKINEWYQIV